MAAIDRTYLKTWDQYTKLKQWVETLGTVTDDYGNRFDLSKWLIPRTEADFARLSKGDDLSVWSTPRYIDIWLIRNCPLDFIQDNLKEQYSGGWSKTALTGYNPTDQYTQILERRSVYDNYSRFGLGKTARMSIDYKVNYRFKDSRMVWWIDIMDLGWWYTKKTDTWNNETFDMRNQDGDSMSHKIFTGNLSRKKLMRWIRKWDLPLGTTIRITGEYDRYIMKEFTVKVLGPRTKHSRNNR